MRAVLDANIYVSALISDAGNPARIIDQWLAGSFEILVSQPIVDEILRVTSYERIQRKYAKVRERRLDFVALIEEQAIWVRMPEKLAVVGADESDNRYVECAVSGGGHYIVTGDRHLLDVGEYMGIMILTPAAFITLLEQGEL